MEKDIILIVDDVESNRLILRDFFEGEYKIAEAGDGRSALDILEKEGYNISLVLLDVVMPVMDGISVLQILDERKVLKDLPVVLITGEDSREIEKKGYEYGVMDYIRKPFDKYITIKRINNILELFRHKKYLEKMVKAQTIRLEEQQELLKKQNQLLIEQNKQVMDLNVAIIESMSNVVEFRNMESGQHIKRIKSFTECLARCIAKEYPEYGLTEERIKVMSEASAMHDIGKIVIPDNILLKPGRLTKEEFEIIKTHTTKGCDVINTIASIQGKEYFDYSYEICRYHHERYDGKGYPEGLVGEAIPISAQIVSVADVYDALTTERVYKSAYSAAEAYKMIQNGECGTFSPRMMKCLTLVKADFEGLAAAYRDNGLPQDEKISVEVAQHE